MSRDLITLDQAKANANVTHEADDEFLEELITEASDAILRYCGSGADTFTDTAGDVIEVAVPPSVVRAAKSCVTHFYRFRGDKNRENVGPSGLPADVEALLVPFRTPTVA